jgi:tight adherence protein B
MPPLAAAGGGILGWLLGGADASPGALLLAAAGIVAGMAAPRVLAAMGKASRRRALDAQLPDALELLANSLRAGLSLTQAVEVAAKELPAPILEEFKMVAQDVRLGLAPEDALEKATLRWPSPDLELFAVAAQVSRRTGGNLAETSAQIVATVRERFRLQGRIAALTSQGILSGWVVGLLPVGLLVAMSLLDPDLISGFLRHPLGWVMLALGIIMELAGAFFIRKIVQIDV